MKIQLDYTNKIVAIESNVNLFEFTKRIKKVLPDWKEWNLQGSISNFQYWLAPIQWDWRQPYVPYFGTSGTISEPTTTTTSNYHCLELN